MRQVKENNPRRVIIEVKDGIVRVILKSRGIYLKLINKDNKDNPETPQITELVASEFIHLRE